MVEFALNYKLLLFIIPGLIGEMSFKPVHYLIFTIINIILPLGISIKSYKLYKSNLNPRLAMICWGFFFGAIFESLHLYYSLLESSIHGDTLIKFLYIAFSHILISGSIFLAIFAGPKFLEKFEKNTFKKMGIFYLLIAIFMLAIAEMHCFISINTYKMIISQIIVNNPTLKTLINALFTLSALALIDNREYYKKIFPLFTLGLLLLGFSQIYFINETYLDSAYRFYVDITKDIGIFFLFIGLTEDIFKITYFSFRPKFSAYSSLFLILTFFIFTSVSSIALKFSFPVFSSYVLMIFFIIAVILQYKLATLLVNPLKDIIKGVKSFNPDEKPQAIPIWSNDELAILTQEFNQNAVFIWQNQERLKDSFTRETLLRELIQDTRVTLDINELFYIVAEKVATTFSAQRVGIVKFTDISNRSWELKKEYKSREELKGPKDIIFNKKSGDYAINRIIEDGYLNIENAQTSNIPDYLKKDYNLLGIKSIIIVPIKDGEEIWGSLGISYVDYYKHWEEDDKKLLFTIAKQIFIAIKQSEFYNTTKKQAERESSSRRIISALRETLDIDKIKQVFTYETGKLLNADRAFIVEYDEENNKFCNVEQSCEYLASKKEKSIIDVEINQKKFNYLFNSNLKDKEVIFSDANKFITQEQLEKTAVIDYFSDYSIKSNITMPILYGNKFFGLMTIQYTHKNVNFNPEDIEFLRILTNQAGIAFYQSNLYKKVQENVKKEKFLKELMSETKPTHNLSEMFNHLIKKISETLNSNLVFFVKIPAYKKEKIATITYEYKKDNRRFLVGKDIRSVTSENFEQKILNMEFEVIKDTREYATKDKVLFSFFEKYNIKSLFIMPLKKGLDPQTATGSIVICFNNIKSCTNTEINLLKSASDGISSTILEIMRRKELDEIRDIFISTLAHDLQVPLIGERRALEFLASRTDISKYSDIIVEVIESNKNVYDLLSRLIQSYNYESGNYKLNLRNYNLKPIIYDALNSLKELANSKLLEINVQIQENLPEIKIDKNEIFKLIYNLLENAETYTQENGKIEIRCYQQEGAIITCISDNGPGIEQDIKKRIFERYAMTTTTQRKIGSGLGLYLSKLIVEAHNGQIWYETKVGKGTIFCFTLPIS